MKAVLFRPLAWLLALAAAGALAQPVQPAPEGPRDSDYLIGLAVSSDAGHLGSQARSQRFQPLWSFQWGRLRFSSSRASKLWHLGRAPFDPGVSTVLIGDDRWALSTSLHYDRGRRSGTDPLFAGLPDIRDTLSGRVSLRYAWDDRWSLRSVVALDLLGRGGGLVWTPGVSYRRPLSPRTQLDLSASASLGNAVHLRTHYGIAPADALAAGRAPYVPAAGLAQWQLSGELSTVLGPRWVAFVGVGFSSLAGDARRSPLVSRRDTWSLATGVAYRCC